VPGFVPQDLDAWRVAWGSGERLEPGLTTVAEEVRALVGVATTGRWSDGRGWVTQLAVSPDARGRGLGRALLLASFAAAGDAGLPSVGLDVNAANESATRLYESAGMRVEWHSDRWEKRL
jgi:ribosomal protein S18 acetylase RimI-like enzyme